MEHKPEKPMHVVENATFALSRIVSLCTIMMGIDGHGIVASEDVAHVMTLFRDCLEEQIEALDGIQWTPRDAEA